MTIDHRLRLSEGSDFPAIAGPRSDRTLFLVAVVTALGPFLRRFLPKLGPGRHARPAPFGGDDAEGRHLRGPP